ncbi:MAG: hypothetical protein IJU43_03990 [Lachnospiraceae bacterium]|nr:hypothetical protein [Lachnospiraceae bacterium]
MCENKNVLVMYDVRGKQEFIFRTNRLKEIAGGSAVIRDIYNDYLYPASGKLGNGDYKIFCYKDADGNTIPGRDFSKDAFEKHLKDGYVGEVVYDGGGNFLLLFKDMETFKNITYKFTKAVMENVGTLQVLGSAVEIDGFDDYKGDQERLRNVHSKNEASESTIAPWVTLPISMIDRRTGMPITIIYDGVECSKETYSKLKKYKTIKDKDSIDIFDKMVEEKGKDSNLAVVYIDGNSMGAKVENVLGDNKDYESCVNKLRSFSDEIQRTYVDEGVKSVENVLEDKKLRVVVAAGDEINFVVKASEAFKCAKKYLEELAKNEGASSCAGIAVFNSHAPYSDAYRIAEECCESGKQLMKEEGIKNACFIDFHLIQNGIGISLDKIRKHEMTTESSRPWLITTIEEGLDESITRYEKVKKIIDIFNEIGRSNVKVLSSAAKNDLVFLKLELRRIKSHYTNNDDTIEKRVKKELDELIKDLDDHAKRTAALIYDIVIAYDLWFKRGDTK